MAVGTKMHVKCFLAQGWDMVARRNCWPSPILEKGEGIYSSMLFFKKILFLYF